MKVTLRASTGVEICVWREGTLFHASRIGSRADPQVCIALDLFEVIAELAELRLEHPFQAREAIELASSAQAKLGTR